MILVVGATGLVGFEVCRQLAARGQAARALVRSTSAPARIAALEELGVELAPGSLLDPGSLDQACAGAHAVVSTASALRSRQPGDTIDAVDRWGQLALVDAAHALGVERFVYVSLPEPAFAEPSPLTEAKRAVEHRLREVTLDWTVLRPAAIMDFWLTPALGLDTNAARARVYGAGDSALSWICAADVARFAIDVLEDPRAYGAEIALGGPQALSQLEAVRVFEEFAGRPFELEHVPLGALHSRIASSADPGERSLLALMAALGQGVRVDMSQVLRSFPGTLCPVHGYAMRVLNARPAMA